MKRIEATTRAAAHERIVQLGFSRLNPDLARVGDVVSWFDSDWKALREVELLHERRKGVWACQTRQTETSPYGQPSPAGAMFQVRVHDLYTGPAPVESLGAATPLPKMTSLEEAVWAAAFAAHLPHPGSAMREAHAEHAARLASTAVEILRNTVAQQPLDTLVDAVIGQWRARAMGQAQPVAQRVSALTLTRPELDVLRSLVEMTLEGSGATFGDWLQANGRKAAVLEALDERLRNTEAHNG